MYQFRTVFNAKTSKWNLQFLRVSCILGVPAWHSWATATRLTDAGKSEVVEFDTFDDMRAYILKAGIAKVYTLSNTDSAPDVSFEEPNSALQPKEADLLHRVIDALAANKGPETQLVQPSQDRPIDVPAERMPRVIHSARAAAIA